MSGGAHAILLCAFLCRPRVLAPCRAQNGGGATWGRAASAHSTSVHPPGCGIGGCPPGRSNAAAGEGVCRAQQVRAGLGPPNCGWEVPPSPSQLGSSRVPAQASRTADRLPLPAAGKPRSATRAAAPRTGPPIGCSQRQKHR